MGSGFARSRRQTRSGDRGLLKKFAGDSGAGNLPLRHLSRHWYSLPPCLAATFFHKAPIPRTLHQHFTHSM